MKVVTLNPEDFAGACRALEEKVAGAFSPDLVVGIASGGLHVSRKLLPHVPHISVLCRRPSTAAKGRSRRLMRQIRRLPLWARNTLRRAEAAWLGKRRDMSRHPEISRDNIAAIQAASRILVVDDAVDSGASLLAVVERLRQINPGAEIRTAAITVTTAAPAIVPDFTLFNRVLIRFPWSKDYR